MAEITLTQSPAHLRMGSSIGQPLTRREGVEKTTGTARFAADNHPPGMVYAALAVSSIARGRILGFEIPYNAQAIDDACNQALAASGLSEAYIRPLAWRGAEQLSVSAQQTRIHLMVAVWAWPNLFGADRMKGVRLGMAPWKRPHPETAPTRAKAAGLYMIGTMSKHHVETLGFNDALMLDWRGQVTEATGANIFFVIDGAIHTPIPDCFLDGITRRTVMRLAEKRQIPVIERVIMPEEMGNATEAFLVGTAAEVTPIRQIETLNFTPGRITETLLADYEALVRMTPEQVRDTLA